MLVYPDRSARLHRFAHRLARVSDKPKAKPRSSKAKASQDGVLGALPSTRPNRLGRPRDEKPQPKPKAAKPRAKAKAKARPKPIVRAKPKAVPPAPTPLTPRAAAGPRGVRPGVPALGDAPQDAPPPAPPQQSGTELVSTVVHAAGELAQIGFTVGGQLIKRAVDRLPKP